MFEKVTKDILLQLNGTKGELVPEFKDEFYLDAVSRLENVASLADLLGALVSLDALVCARITLKMVDYKLDVPVGTQPDRSAGVLAQARFLLGAYKRVLADSAAAKAVTASLGDFADKFTLDEATTYKSSAALEFLTSVRQIILLSLAAGKYAGASKLLLDQLAAAGQAVKISIFYKEEPSSFLAYPASSHPYCKGTGNKEIANLTERFATVVRDDGGPSQLAAPVWLAGASAGELLGATFKSIGVAAALDQIFTGSLSFTRDQAPFYTPPRLEILHELVHVLHNARGENREKVGGMTKEERGTWTNPEEYWTIAGDAVSESALNAQIGAPDRYGHSGLPLPFLAPGSPAAKYSLRQHALREVV